MDVEEKVNVLLRKFMAYYKLIIDENLFKLTLLLIYLFLYMNYKGLISEFFLLKNGTFEDQSSLIAVKGNYTTSHLTMFLTLL